jgi:hypothetical protein
LKIRARTDRLSVRHGRAKMPVMTWATYGEFLAFATGVTGGVLLGFSARLAAEHA